MRRDSGNDRHLTGVRRSSGKVWAGSFLTGAAVTAAVAWLRKDGFYAQDPGALYGSLSDGAFVAGVMLLGAGLLLWVSTTGFFDMFAYGAQGVWHHLFPFLRPKKRVEYYEFLQTKEKKRRAAPAALLGSGSLFLVLAVLALYLYTR